MSSEPLRRLVEGLGERVPHEGLERLRAEQRPLRPETLERLLAIARRGGPHAGLEELVEAYGRGETTWSVLRAHPRMVAAQQERTEEVLAAVRRARAQQG